jgi:hypothetical protein
MLPNSTGDNAREPHTVDVDLGVSRKRVMDARSPAIRIGYVNRIFHYRRALQNSAEQSEQRQLFSRGTTPAAFERTWLDKLDGHRRSVSDDP